MQTKSSAAAGVLALLVAASATSSADTYPRQPGLDILHYAFHLTLSDETDAIEGEATVEFRVVQAGVSTLTLDLSQAKGAAPDRGMKVSAVTEGGKAARFEHASDRLVVGSSPS